MRQDLAGALHGGSVAWNGAAGLGVFGRHDQIWDTESGECVKTLEGKAL